MDVASVSKWLLALILSTLEKIDRIRWIHAVYIVLHLESLV